MPDITQGTQFLKEALDAIRDFIAMDMKYVPASPSGIEVWMTDFDMNQRREKIGGVWKDLAIHGTWADGLYMGLMTLCF